MKQRKKENIREAEGGRGGGGKVLEKDCFSRDLQYSPQGEEETKRKCEVLSPTLNRFLE